MLNEKDIKAAVIEKIRHRIEGENSALINEMVFNNGSRRADLVLAAKNLHAFEIKSDVDNLKRLDGQINDYLSTFDKVILVVSSKYIEYALKIDSRVAIWEAYRNNYGVTCIHVLRAGKTSPITSHQALCNFLLKRELIKIIKENLKKSNINNLSRDDLIKMCNKIPFSIIKNMVMQSIIARYREISLSFFKTCSKTIEPADLLNLSKSKIRKQFLEDSLGHTERAKTTSELRKINLEKFFPEGDIPESIPRFVLVPST